MGPGVLVAQQDEPAASPFYTCPEVRVNLSPARPLRASVAAEAGRLSQGLEGSNPHLCKAGRLVGKPRDPALAVKPETIIGDYGQINASVNECQLTDTSLVWASRVY